MTDFYNRYRSLFEEDEFSSNHSLNYFSGGNNMYGNKFGNAYNDEDYLSPLKPLKFPSYQNQVPDQYQPLEQYKLPTRESYEPVSQSPNINILHSLPQKRNTTSVTRIDPNELNRVLNDYGDIPNPPKFTLPSLPNPMAVKPSTPIDTNFRRRDSALRNVYQQSLVNKNTPIRNYYDLLKDKELELKTRKATIEENQSIDYTKEVPLKDTYKPEIMTSNVPENQNIFPTPEKKGKEPEEYAFLRRIRDAKKHRERAKKQLRVI